MELTQIYVLVGKKIRPAKARITGAGIAVIYTESGPVEIKRWYKTEQEARYAGGVKLIGDVYVDVTGAEPASSAERPR